MAPVPASAAFTQPLQINTKPRVRRRDEPIVPLMEVNNFLVLPDQNPQSTILRSVQSYRMMHLRRSSVTTILRDWPWCF